MQPKCASNDKNVVTLQTHKLKKLKYLKTKKLTDMRTVFIAMLMACCTLTATAQEKPQVKVDVSITNRNNPDETLEPGYEWWKPSQGKQSDTYETGGLKFTFLAPDNVEPNYIVRTGWAKTYIQNAANKSQNGRLLYDGISLDPDDNSVGQSDYYGQLTLKIEGLPVDSHTLMTYHNCWASPDKTYCAPMTIRSNGSVVAEGVVPTLGVAVAANTTIVTIPITIASEGDVALIDFITDAAHPGTAESGKTEFKTPLVNGFELNTVDVSTQAKEPWPASGDMHVDADSKSITLQWTAANDKVKEHRLFLAVNDESQLSFLATIPAPSNPSGEALSYPIDGLYSMNTYYWRVDEVDAQGNVVEGQVWKFKPRQLAFPGAEGYGRFAQGGRGGQVYHVTSLSNDNVPGTLKYGLLMEGPRYIVFDVSGIIEMDFGALFPPSHATIAGQTAPGKGICIKASNINIGSEIVCRHIRFKRGLGVYGENTGNAMGMSGADHSIVDHCTAAWGTDETVSGRGAKNISFQYNVISEALGIAGHKNYNDGTNHGFAATIDGKVGSYHHNLLVNCNGRNWSMGGGMDGENRAIGQMDIFNNVCYNWNGRTTDGGCHEVNFVNNYYKMGPDTKRTQLFTQQYENIGHIESTWQAYIAGNIRENKNHTLTQDKYGDTYNYTLSNGATDPNKRTDQYAYKTFVDECFFPSYATIHTAKDAMKIVTSYSGATMPVRDEHHQRNIRETLQGTYTYIGSKSKIKGEIDTEEDITEHAEGKGWESYPEEHRAADWDTDQDGMPDWWEQCIGSDPVVANQNDDPDGDGWTLLEDYLDFMAHPYILLSQGEQGTIDLRQHFAGFYGQNGKSVTPTYTLDCMAGGFSPAIDGSVLTVKASNTPCVGSCEVTVNDGETTFTQRFGIAVTGNTTGIQDVERSLQSKAFFAEQSGKAERNVQRSTYYNLHGQRLSQPQKGLNILNGKKTITR